MVPSVTGVENSFFRSPMLMAVAGEKAGEAMYFNMLA